MSDPRLELLRRLQSELGWYENVDRLRYRTPKEVDIMVVHSVRTLCDLKCLSEDRLIEMRRELLGPSDDSGSERYERLGRWLELAENLIEQELAEAGAKAIEPMPDVAGMPFLSGDLGEIIEQRWTEAQKCLSAQSYTAAIVMMGSVL